jgi:hypothetical protein
MIDRDINPLVIIDYAILCQIPTDAAAPAEFTQVCIAFHVPVKLSPVVSVCPPGALLQPVTTKFDPDTVPPAATVDPLVLFAAT